MIFTLDDKMGGYHRTPGSYPLVSQLITRYYREHKNDNSFGVQKSYRGCFPPSL